VPELGSDAAGVASLAAELKTRFETLARLHGELLRRKAQTAAIGGGIALAGIMLLVVSVLVGLAAIAAGLATVLEPWLAILILFGGLVILGLVLVGLGVAIIKRKARSGSEKSGQIDQALPALTSSSTGAAENG
jgi:hypothetical protein